MSNPYTDESGVVVPDISDGKKVDKTTTEFPSQSEDSNQEKTEKKVLKNHKKRRNKKKNTDKNILIGSEESAVETGVKKEMTVEPVASREQKDTSIVQEKTDLAREDDTFGRQQQSMAETLGHVTCKDVKEDGRFKFSNQSEPDIASPNCHEYQNSEGTYKDFVTVEEPVKVDGMAKVKETNALVLGNLVSSAARQQKSAVTMLGHEEQTPVVLEEPPEPPDRVSATSCQRSAISGSCLEHGNIPAIKQDEDMQIPSQPSLYIDANPLRASPYSDKLRILESKDDIWQETIDLSPVTNTLSGNEPMSNFVPRPIFLPELSDPSIICTGRFREYPKFAAALNGDGSTEVDGERKRSATPSFGAGPPRYPDGLIRNRNDQSPPSRFSGQQKEAETRVILEEGLKDPSKPPNRASGPFTTPCSKRYPGVISCSCPGHQNIPPIEQEEMQIPSPSPLYINANPPWASPYSNRTMALESREDIWQKPIDRSPVANTFFGNEPMSNFVPRPILLQELSDPSIICTGRFREYSKFPTALNGDGSTEVDGERKRSATPSFDIPISIEDLMRRVGPPRHPDGLIRNRNDQSPHQRFGLNQTVPVLPKPQVQSNVHASCGQGNSTRHRNKVSGSNPDTAAASSVAHRNGGSRSGSNSKNVSVKNKRYDNLIGYPSGLNTAKLRSFVKDRWQNAMSQAVGYPGTGDPREIIIYREEYDCEY